MPYKLLSATPSPYARKVRIALLEKKIPFELLTEVPWDSTTKTPEYNPLEKLPVLISTSDNGEVKESVYDSAMILEWIEAIHPSPPLLPTDVHKRLKAKQIETLCDGICDALVLYFFEQQRDEGYASKPWMERQARKVNGGLTALSDMVEKDANKGQGWLLGDGVGFSHADLCAGTCVAYVRLRGPSFKVDEHWPILKAFNERCETRESFKLTVPKAQSFQDKVV